MGNWRTVRVVGECPEFEEQAKLREMLDVDFMHGRKGKRHPSTVKGNQGPLFRSLNFKCTREQTHATGALKRSERHPGRGKGSNRKDLAWRYVCR